MKLVTLNELSSYKILPFDLYDENKNALFSAGDVLTPGKLLVLKKYAKIFAADKDEEQEEVVVENKSKSESEIKQNNVILTEDLEKNIFTFDSIDASEFDTVANKCYIIDIENQIKIKYFFKKILDLFQQEQYKYATKQLIALVDILNNHVFKNMKQFTKGSQSRFLGEYELCHPLNVAIICGFIAKKLDYQPNQIEATILAGLLHDIGKLTLEKDSQNTTSMLNIDAEIGRLHVINGYKIIKNKLNLSEKIAQAVLEHHENNDGSGFPKGISSDYISEIGQIVNVANCYDNIANNRTNYYITSNRDVLHTMLEIGAKKFSVKILYTFVHMFSYDDTKFFSEMEI